jgi:hypothetical protein
MITNTDVERNKKVLADLDAKIDKTKTIVLELADYVGSAKEHTDLEAFLEHVSDQQLLDYLVEYYNELANEKTADLL